MASDPVLDAVATMKQAEQEIVSLRRLGQECRDAIGNYAVALDLGDADGIHMAILRSVAALKAWDQHFAPYPWCNGFPTIKACVDRGYCAKDPNCGE
jgi:hypothetical protein